MPKPTRAELGQLIADRLERESGALQAAWMESKPVRHAVIDDLLPDALEKTNGLAAASFTAGVVAMILLGRLVGL